MVPAPDVLQQFGARLKQERLRLGISQELLADRAQLDRTYVSGVERGTRNLGLRNIGVLAEALGIEPAVLLRPAELAIDASVLPAHTYRYDSATGIDCSLQVDSLQVIAAVAQSNRILEALPLNLFMTIDLKTQSGIVGAVFAAELATRIGALPNPIEKGHPDIVPASAAGASEAELRNYPTGLEIKSTLGSVAKGSALTAGQARINALIGIVWQAHHRDVRSLMGLVWDFAEGSRTRLRHPSVTAVFYTSGLLEQDWGQISGTTGRNTKVTGMTVSGRRKMGAGAIVVLNDARYLQTYARCLGLPSFGNLDHSTL